MDEQNKPSIIFDTDMDTDCDDAGALGLLIKFVQSGKANILAAVADTPVKEAAPCIEAIANYYGASFPIGAVNVKKYETDPRFDAYRKHREHLSSTAYYNRVLASRLQKCNEDYEPAATVYRKALSSAEDKSVTVVCVGLLTAIAELFETVADETSPLSGIDLFARKVRCVITMGNAEYPETVGKNFNYNMDRIGTKTFFEKCPVPIFVSPDGTDIITGYSFTSSFPKKHPLRISYEAFTHSENKGRSSWDLITLLYAFEEYHPHFKTETHGTVKYDTENRTYWQPNGNRKDTLVKVGIPSGEMAEFLEKLLII